MSIIEFLSRLFGYRPAMPPARQPDPVLLSTQDLPLLSIDPVTLAAIKRTVRTGHCGCVGRRTKHGKAGMPDFHSQYQDVDVAGWREILRCVEVGIASKSEVFEPSAMMAPSDWANVITLPDTIRELTQVRELRLYGSHLRRVPPEIGYMSNLENLDIYTSYSLHWLPYEVTRCQNLRSTRMSTRAMYGNRNTRMPFPRLHAPQPSLTPQTCSVCDQPFGAHQPHLFWTTLWVGTDLTPLLIHSCSVECTDRVPNAAEGYRPRPHKGGGAEIIPSRY